MRWRTLLSRVVWVFLAGNNWIPTSRRNAGDVEHRVQFVGATQQCISQRSSARLELECESPSAWKRHGTTQPKRCYVPISTAKVKNDGLWTSVAPSKVNEAWRSGSVPVWSVSVRPTACVWLHVSRIVIVLKRDRGKEKRQEEKTKKTDKKKRHRKRREKKKKKKEEKAKLTGRHKKAKRRK